MASPFTHSTAGGARRDAAAWSRSHLRASAGRIGACSRSFTRGRSEPRLKPARATSVVRSAAGFSRAMARVKTNARYGSRTTRWESFRGRLAWVQFDRASRSLGIREATSAEHRRRNRAERPRHGSTQGDVLPTRLRLACARDLVPSHAPHRYVFQEPRLFPHSPFAEPALPGGSQAVTAAGTDESSD